MTKRIERDLFARLMRLSARERTDILEFLGQSPVSAGRLDELVERPEAARARPDAGNAILNQMQS